MLLAMRLGSSSDRRIDTELRARKTSVSRLSTAYAMLTMAFLTIPLKGMGGHHAPSKETLEAEASGMRGTVVGGRRVVVVAGERSIRDTRWPRWRHHSR